MKYLIAFISLFTLCLSCKKQDICIVAEEEGFAALYDVVSCDIGEEINGIQTVIYYDVDEFNSSPCFFSNPILPLDKSKILIMVFRVKSDYYYEKKKVDILRDQCENRIFFNFTLSNKVDSIGQVDNFYHSALSVLDSVFTEQEVIFDVKFE